MKTIKQQRLDFLNDTVSYYSEDTSRRAVDKDSIFCMYYNESTNNKCAIGRHINPEDYKNNQLEEGYTVKDYYVFALLPETVRRLGKEFLRDVQDLHDNKSNWNKDKGLSKLGKEKVSYITRYYCN